jgi:hypothetical protein
LVEKPDWITSQQSALQFKDLAWKENRSRSPLTRTTNTLFSVTTALFGGSPSRPMVLPGNSCRASRNHPANLRVPDSNERQRRQKPDGQNESRRNQKRAK